MLGESPQVKESYSSLHDYMGFILQNRCVQCTPAHTPAVCLERNKRKNLITQTHSDRACLKWASSRENLSSGFRLGKTQTGLLSYRDKLES